MTYEPRQTLSVSFQSLLRVYWLIPFTFGVLFVDHFILKGYLQRHIPSYPEHLRFYAIFLILPHVIASASSFIDRDYLKFYRFSILKGIAVAAFLVLATPHFGIPYLPLIVYVIYTIYHLFTQQAGITLFMVGKPILIFHVWKWLVILIGILIYLKILIPPATMHQLWGAHSSQIVNGALISMLISMTWAAIALGRRSNTRIGIAYLWANCGMVAIPAFYYAVGYSFLGVFLARAVHDMTAFLFYAVHDHNRNINRTPNMVYKLLRFTGIPIIFLCPVLAIVLANTFIELRIYPWIAKSLLMLAFFHYYSEGFMWKRGTPHRDNVPVVKGLAA